MFSCLSDVVKSDNLWATVMFYYVVDRGVGALQRRLAAPSPPSPQGVDTAVAEIQLGSDDSTTESRLTSLLVCLCRHRELAPSTPEADKS